MKSFDIAQEAGGQGKPVIKEFRGIKIGDDLTIEMKTTSDSRVNAPVLCGISAVAE